MTITINVERVNVISDNVKLDKILTLLEESMSQMQETIDALSIALAENTSATQSAKLSFETLTAKVQELLKAAADAPTLEETNALIAKAQEAVAVIEANSDVLVAASLANIATE